MQTILIQRGVTVWIILLLLSGLGGLVIGSLKQHSLQASMQKTLASLALAQQGLLAYASQPLGTTPCEMNCPRPGDLPCPDRNNDGVAETSCSTTSRLGRLPWKTLGIGDLRDGSGERLWYAVSERYKNNPRVLPLNTEIGGTWSLSTETGNVWDATQGSGVVAVIIAPMQPLLRNDGWPQQRDEASSEIAKHFLDMTAAGDNANPIENTVSGFVAAPASRHFNDVVWPLTATVMHRYMQQQVLSEVKRAIRCTTVPCSAFPLSAAVTDDSCLSSQTLTAGKCLAVSAGLGRLPLDASAHWPLAAQHMLDGEARHHWFQQNGWREQVFYLPTAGHASLVMAGEKLPGQARDSAMQRLVIGAYLESATLQALNIQDVTAPTIAANDTVERVILP